MFVGHNESQRCVCDKHLASLLIGHCRTSSIKHTYVKATKLPWYMSNYWVMFFCIDQFLAIGYKNYIKCIRWPFKGVPGLAYCWSKFLQWFIEVYYSKVVIRITYLRTYSYLVTCMSIIMVMNFKTLTFYYLLWYNYKMCSKWSKKNECDICLFTRYLF